MDFALAGRRCQISEAHATAVYVGKETTVQDVLDHVAALNAALKRLLGYTLQLELLVYPEATGGEEHDAVEEARAMLLRWK